MKDSEAPPSSNTTEEVVAVLRQPKRRRRMAKKPSTNTCELFSLDNLDFRLDIPKEDPPRRAHATRNLRSLSLLLAQREMGLVRNKSSWRRSVLMPDDGDHRYQFRESARRKIEFTALQTPFSDAVLAVDPSGSYVLCVGGEDVETDNDNDESMPSVALRFYGLPSPASLSKPALGAVSRPPRSPLLLTIPLTYQRDGHAGDFAIFSLSSTSPVLLWIDRDWRVGVAFLRQSRPMQLPPSGSFVLFLLPHGSSQHTTKSFRLENVPMSKTQSYGGRKRQLWAVDAVPVPDADGATFMSLSATQGYVFYLPLHGSGRLTWFRASSWNEPRQWARPSRAAPPGFVVATDPFIQFTGQSEWTEWTSDSISGAWQHDHAAGYGDLEIVGEAQLSFCQLLRDVLDRRPKLVSQYEKGGSKLPTHHGEVVLVYKNGRQMEVILAFHVALNKVVAVVLQVDLLTQSYRGLKWVKLVMDHQEKASFNVVEWVNRLVLYQQVFRRRLGPYSVKTVEETGWSHAIEQEMTEPEEWTEENPALWDKALPQTRPRPGRVSSESLYPDSHVLDNWAIITRTPVLSLKSRSAPVEVVYG